MTLARTLGALGAVLALCACSGQSGTTSDAGRTGPAPRSSASGTGTATADGSSVAMRPVLVEQAVPQPSSAAASPSLADTTVSTPSAGTGTTGTATGRPTPTDASDLNWITPDVEAAFVALDCRSTRPAADDVPPTRPLVTCSTTGDSKYVLGPVELTGQDIADAQAQPVPDGQAGGWMVAVRTTDAGRARFQAVTRRLAGLDGSRNEFALVVKGAIVSAPHVQEAITGGVVQVTGNFTKEQAQELASALHGRTP